MSTTVLSRRVAAFAAIALTIVAGFAAAQQIVHKPSAANPGSASAQIDALLAAAYPPDRPGAAAIVVKDGTPILRKGYGLADVELNVPIEPDMVFRVGSVTKQFTATAILILAERGRLAIGDPITKFLPDYPAQGKTITIEHLLTHTSGIKSYTGMPAWLPLMMKDLSVSDVIDVFKNEPFDFAPGERWLYNNSGYFLLGAIIEKVSGKTYEEFIQQEIFTPLGMTASYYGSHARIIPRRVPGYEKRGSQYVNAAYLSMTQPYAAGSLLSTVDDLAKWDAAISAGTLLRPASYKKMFTAYALSSGESTGYGYGWGIASYDGHPAVGHGGGINGFICYVLRMPEDKVYVAVLSNNASNDANPSELASLAGAIAIGKPVTDPPAISMDAAALDAYVGTYQGAGPARRVVTRDGTRLFMTGGGPRVEILPVSPTEFSVKGSTLRVTFEKDASGRVVRLTAGGWGLKEAFTRAQ